MKIIEEYAFQTLVTKSMLKLCLNTITENLSLKNRMGSDTIHPL